MLPHLPLRGNWASPLLVSLRVAFRPPRACVHSHELPANCCTSLLVRISVAKPLAWLENQLSRRRPYLPY